MTLKECSYFSSGKLIKRRYKIAYGFPRDAYTKYLYIPVKVIARAEYLRRASRIPGNMGRVKQICSPPPLQKNKFSLVVVGGVGGWGEGLSEILTSFKRKLDRISDSTTTTLSSRIIGYTSIAFWENIHGHQYCRNLKAFIFLYQANVIIYVQKFL